MPKENETPAKPLTVKQAGDRYNALMRAEFREVEGIQKRVAELNVHREEALKALNSAIIEEVRSKAQAKAAKRIPKAVQA